MTGSPPSVSGIDSDRPRAVSSRRWSCIADWLSIAFWTSSIRSDTELVIYRIRRNRYVCDVRNLEFVFGYELQLVIVETRTSGSDVEAGVGDVGDRDLQSCEATRCQGNDHRAFEVFCKIGRAGVIQCIERLQYAINEGLHADVIGDADEEVLVRQQIFVSVRQKAIDHPTVGRRHVVRRGPGHGRRCGIRNDRSSR